MFSVETPPTSSEFSAPLKILSSCSVSDVGGESLFPPSFFSSSTFSSARLNPSFPGFPSLPLPIGFEPDAAGQRWLTEPLCREKKKRRGGREAVFVLFSAHCSPPLGSIPVKKKCVVVLIPSFNFFLHRSFFHFQDHFKLLFWKHFRFRPFWIFWNNRNNASN